MPRITYYNDDRSGDPENNGQLDIAFDDGRRFAVVPDGIRKGVYRERPGIAAFVAEGKPTQINVNDAEQVTNISLSNSRAKDALVMALGSLGQLGWRGEFTPEAKAYMVALVNALDKGEAPPIAELRRAYPYATVLVAQPVTPPPPVKTSQPVKDLTGLF